ncbi:MAG: RagB/SusD family nutrient uptake outer membrane protein, partial [Muribaculaceae bacterium]|nr:RagB/SusD family nutrient uptake outer membrane protein [Muribaculaceae bacterium]
MKNIFKKLTIAAVALASAATYTGCQSDLLDTTPTYMYSSANVWKSPILARSAVKGVYNSLYARFTQNYTGSSLGIPMDCWSSVMDIDRNWRGGLFTCTGSLTPSDGNLAGHFKLYYTVVYRANDAIMHIDDVPDMDDDEKARLKAECKFLRAWGYFYLNLYWRGVPVYLETVAPEEATLPRSTEAEVWNQVIQDLTDVINEPNIPDRYNKGNANYGNATRGAALAYRGQVYQHIGDNAKALADFEAIERCG